MEGIPLTKKTRMFDDTRAGILKLSASWIAKESYHGTSLSELLRMTGIGKGGFYYHFASKEQLLLEVMLAPIERVLESGQKIVTREGPAADRLIALGNDLGVSVDDDLDSWMAFLREYSALSDESKSRVLERRREYLELWYAIIRDGQASGEFREMDPSFVESILGVYVYTFVWATGGKSSQELIGSVMEMLLHGVER